MSGIAGISHKLPIQSVTRFQLSSLQPSGRKIDVTAVVVPKVTCDLPLKPVTFEIDWTHLLDLPLANPEFGQPSRIDILLGADIFIEVLCQGWRNGPTGTPQLLKLTLAGFSVEALDSPQPLCKPMSTSRPSTPQPPLMISSGGSGKLKNHLLTKLSYPLRNVELFVTLSLTTHALRKDAS